MIDPKDPIRRGFLATPETEQLLLSAGFTRLDQDSYDSISNRMEPQQIAVWVQNNSKHFLFARLIYGGSVPRPAHELKEYLLVREASREAGLEFLKS